MMVTLMIEFKEELSGKLKKNTHITQVRPRGVCHVGLNDSSLADSNYQRWDAMEIQMTQSFHHGHFIAGFPSIC